MTVEQQQQQQQGSTPVLPFHKMILLPDDRLVAAFGKYLAVMNVETSRVIAGPADLKLSESAVAMPEESFATSQIIALDYSPEANLLVVIADDKSLITYDCTKWTVVYRVVCPKRANDVKFVEKGTKILIADKFGDVSRFDIANADETPTLLMGHVSLLTSLIMAPNDRFMITTDRDEHVRVTEYPKTNNIQSFCLGHRDLVYTSMIPSWDPSIVISAGCDSWLGVWDYEYGKLISKFDLTPLVNEVKMVKFTVVKTMQPIPGTRNIILVIEEQPFLFVLSFEDRQLALLRTIALENPALDVKASKSCIFVSTIDADKVGTTKVRDETMDSYLFTSAEVLVLSTSDYQITRRLDLPLVPTQGTPLDPFGVHKSSKNYMKLSKLEKRRAVEDESKNDVKRIKSEDMDD